MIRNEHLQKVIACLPFATEQESFQKDFHDIVSRLRAAEKVLTDITQMTNVTDLGAATNFDKAKVLAEEHLTAIQ